MGSIDRRNILNKLREPVERDLNQSVKFIVYKMVQCKEWVYIRAKPIKENGKSIDYTGTQFQEMIEDGMFDEGVQALIRSENGRWELAEYSIGGTDSPIMEWLEVHGISDCLNKF